MQDFVTEGRICNAINVLNGFLYINKKHIKNINSITNTSFSYKVLHLKYSIPDIPPCGNYQSLMEYILSNNLLIAFGLESEKFIIVGNVYSINNKSVSIIKYDSLMNPTGKINIPYNSIRFVSLYSDYLNSLTLYINSAT